MFHWTSARCSFFQFQAAWRNQQGKGAASCCHHEPVEETVIISLSCHSDKEMWIMILCLSFGLRARLSIHAKHPKGKYDEV